MKEKSQSKRIRDLLYRIWENSNTRIKDSEIFYQIRTNEIIEGLQKELSELTEPPVPEDI